MDEPDEVIESVLQETVLEEIRAQPFWDVVETLVQEVKYSQDPNQNDIKCVFSLVDRIKAIIDDVRHVNVLPSPAMQALSCATIRALTCTERIACNGYTFMRQSAEALGWSSLTSYVTGNSEPARQPRSQQKCMLKLEMKHSLCFCGCFSCLSRNLTIKANTKIMKEGMSIESPARLFFPAFAS